MSLERLPNELEFAKQTYGQSFDIPASETFIGEDYDADLEDDYCDECMDGYVVEHAAHCDTCDCEEEVKCPTCGGTGTRD